MGDEQLPFCVLAWIYQIVLKTLIMPKPQKDKDDNIPNLSKYDYVDVVPAFSEADRLLESDLLSLECYKDFQIEAPLNSFSDRLLNDHLYSVFKCKQKDTDFM